MILCIRLLSYIKQLKMPKILISLGFVLLLIFSCEKSTDADMISATAMLRNDIAVDGCEWHIAIDLKDQRIQYATSESSKSKVDAVISQSNGASGVWSINVKIDYKITGKKKVVQCGWGVKQSMDEIEIINIQKN